MDEVPNCSLNHLFLPKDGYVAEPSLLQCTRGRFDPETFICEPGKSWIVGELPGWEEETTGIHV